jgi:hypothetical protein
MEGVREQWGQALLMLYAFWQVKFQKYVNDSYVVWSSSLYVPYSNQNIQHIEYRVRNWSISHCVCAVFENVSFTVRRNTTTFI